MSFTDFFFLQFINPVIALFSTSAPLCHWSTYFVRYANFWGRKHWTVCWSPLAGIQFLANRHWQCQSIGVSSLKPLHCSAGEEEWAEMRAGRPKAVKAAELILATYIKEDLTLKFERHGISFPTMPPSTSSPTPSHPTPPSNLLEIPLQPEQGLLFRVKPSSLLKSPIINRAKMRWWWFFKLILRIL